MKSKLKIILKSQQLVPTLPSKLDKETQELIKLIYDKDMFKDAMKKFDIGNRNTSL